MSVHYTLASEFLLVSYEKKMTLVVTGQEREEDKFF